MDSTAHVHTQNFTAGGQLCFSFVFQTCPMTRTKILDEFAYSFTQARLQLARRAVQSSAFKTCDSARRDLPTGH